MDVIAIALQLTYLYITHKRSESNIHVHIITDYYCTRCLSSCFRKVNLCSRFSLRSRIAHVIFRNITCVALTKNMADTCVRLASRPGLCQTYIGVRLG